MNYNLLEEEWIPVLYHDGRWERVGIRKALGEAHQIRQIAASNPMDRVATLRFLLAVLYWCKGSPPKYTSGKFDDPLPANWFSKLDENRECFNLLGDGKRFYQHSPSKQTVAEHATHYLIHEIPSGTNKWHFRHATDRREGLCPACCAMGLLRLPAFATSGGKGMDKDSGKSPGINQKPPLYMMPVGVSLAQTLRLSWRPCENLQTPEWETPDAKLPKKGHVPLLMGLTWLPRRVWLTDPEEPEGKCISCGRKERLIRRCMFDGKGSQKTEGRIWRDPHVIYEQSRKGDITSLHAKDALSAADAGAGQWARILAGMLRKNEASDAAYPFIPDAWVVGFSTIQSDKYLEAIEFLVALPSSHQIQESIERIERWQKERSTLTRRLRPRNEKSLSRRHVEIPPILAAVRPHIEGSMFAKAGELAGGTDEAWQRAAEEYRPFMRKIARSLSPGFTTAAVQRRREIGFTVPDMEPKTENTKKPGRKKGGQK